MATNNTGGDGQKLVQTSQDLTSSQFELLEDAIDSAEPPPKQQTKAPVKIPSEPEEVKASNTLSPASISHASPIKPAVSSDFDAYINKRSPQMVNTPPKSASKPLQTENITQADIGEIEQDAEESEEEATQFQCKECLCYLLFLVIFTATAIFSIGTGDLNYTQTSSIRTSLVLKDQFVPWNAVGEKRFDDVSTIADIYQYLRQVLVPFLMSNPRSFNDSNMYIVQNRHVLMGGVRLRQIRLTPTECDICFDSHAVHTTFNGVCDTEIQDFDGEECYDDRINRENVTFYASDMNETTDEGVEYVYVDSEVLLDQRYQGFFHHYPGGGYIQDLPANNTQSLQIIDMLEELQWIDAATLMVSVDFTVYNPSDSLHTVARLVWEMPTAGIFSNDEIKTWKFDRYHGEISGFVLFIMHIFFALMIVSISGMMFVDVYRHHCDKQEHDKTQKKPKFWDFWRVLDMLNILIFYMTMVLLIYNESVQKNLIDLFNTKRYYSYRRLQALSQFEAYSFAVNGFLLWLKLFRYLGFFPKFRFLFYMLGRGWQDIVMFMVILFVFYLAFALSGFVVFSSDVVEYRTFAWSIVSMNIYFLQEVNVDDLVASSRFVGNAYYFLWIVWMSFILVNVFIAILIDSYSKTQVEIELDAANVSYFNVFEKGREYVKQLQGAVLASAFDALDEDGDDNVDVNEIAHALKISMEEAQSILNRFDTDGNGVLDRKEFESLKQKLIRERMGQVDEDVSPAMHTLHTGMQMQDAATLKEQVGELKELMNIMLSVDPIGKRALKQKQAHGENWKYKRVNSVK